MHYEDDPESYSIQYEYLFGRDLLVAPVYQAEKLKWSVYLPDDDWVNLWTDESFRGGHHEVDAPLGQIPVFYRKQSSYTDLFKTLKQA